MEYINEIVLTEEQIERYTKELESDKWREFYNERISLW